MIPDMFCRLNVDSDLPFQDFVTLVQKCSGGAAHGRSVQSGNLDILIDENDCFDEKKPRIGVDRWLYFRYTMEVDPIEGADPVEYIRSICELLESIWSAGLDAVAACEFEEQLPTNNRRLKWSVPERNGQYDAAAANSAQKLPVRQG